MAILHLIRTSPSNNDNLELCLNLLSPEDIIVLIDDGCYCLTNVKLATLNKNQLYIVKEHAAVRAINLDKFHQSISVEQLLGLISNKTKTITWQ